MANSMDMNLSKLWEIVKDRGAWYATVHGLTNSWTVLVTEYTHTHTHTHTHIKKTKLDGPSFSFPVLWAWEVPTDCLSFQVMESPLVWEII